MLGLFFRWPSPINPVFLVLGQSPLSPSKQSRHVSNPELLVEIPPYDKPPQVSKAGSGWNRPKRHVCCGFWRGIMPVGASNPKRYRDVRERYRFEVVCCPCASFFLRALTFRLLGRRFLSLVVTAAPSGRRLSCRPPSIIRGALQCPLGCL